MLTRDDLRESLAVQEWLEEGRKEGRAIGREEVRQELREQYRQVEGEILLRRAAVRFPGLHLTHAVPPSVDLLDFAEEIMLARDEAAAHGVLAAHRL